MAKELTKDERIIVRGYKEGLKNIRKDINLLYEKHAKDGKLSAADLSKYNRLTNLEKNIADNLKTAYDVQVRTTKKAVKGAFESAFYYGTFELEQEAKMNLMFGLLKKEAVNAVVEGPNRWPQIAKGHTKLTNAKIRDQIMQGVVQGKDAGQVTKAIAKEMNIAASKACRIVRTETHRAQNQGSLDSYTEAYKKGVLIQKVWVATLDDRTRDSHRVMDGQVVEVYEDFIMPGDIKASAPGLSGSASGDINCRCTIRAEVVGFTPQARRARGDGIIPQQTYQQWAKSKGIPFNKDMADEVKKLLEARGASKVGIESAVRDYINRLDMPAEEIKEELDKIYKDYYAETLSKEHIEAIERYRSSGYVIINSYLRGIDKEMYGGEKYTKVMNDLLDAIKKVKIKEDMIVTRSTTIDWLGGLKWEELKPGQIIVEDGFMSASVRGNIGKEFAKLKKDKDAVVLIEAKVNKGTNGVFVDTAVNEIWEKNMESEIILKPGARFIVEEKWIDENGIKRLKGAIIGQTKAEQTAVKAPKTLKNIEKHQEEWYNSRFEQLVSGNDQAVKFMDDVADNLKKLIDSNDLCMRVPDADVLSKILDDGRFKTQFETNTSKGTLAHDFRKGATEALFGADVDKLEPRDFEKYGYLGSSDLKQDFKRNNARQYGDIVVRFKKENLVARTTITVGDSLGAELIGVPVTKPSALAFPARNLEREMKASVKSGGNAFVEIFEDNDIIDVNRIIEDFNRPYFELQYHGDLGVSDIESITTEDELDASIVGRLKDLGIEYNVV